MVIYKITNLVNHKVYIGQTTNTFNQRYKGKGVGAERLIASTSANANLLNAIAKHGVNNFKVEIIEQCQTIDKLNEREAYYVEHYDSNNELKGYNKVGGGENRYWDWKKVLRVYITNEEKCEQQVNEIKKLSKKLNIHYKEVMIDIHKRPIFKVSKTTGRVTMYENILACCYRDNYGKPNQNSKSATKSYVSPVNILILCKQANKDELYTSLLKTKDNPTSDFYFCQDAPSLMEQYQQQINEEQDRKTSKAIEKKEKKKICKVYKCQRCGKEYKNVSKYCADCNRKMHEEKLSSGKTVKECTCCGKQHTRSHPTCSTQCSAKLRNIRKNVNVTICK